MAARTIHLHSCFVVHSATDGLGTKNQGSRLKNIVLITDSPPKPHTVRQEETEHSLAAWGSPGMPARLVLTYLIPHDASRLATCLFVSSHQLPLPSLPASAKRPSFQTSHHDFTALVLNS